jgi:hypothetical protein
MIIRRLFVDYYTEIAFTNPDGRRSKPKILARVKVGYIDESP